MECNIRGAAFFTSRLGRASRWCCYMEGLFEPLFAKRTGWQRNYLDLPGCGQTRAGHFLGIAEQSQLAGALTVEWLERVELERNNGKKSLQEQKGSSDG